MKGYRIVALSAVLGALSSAAMGQQAPPAAGTPPAQQPAPSETPPPRPAPAATPPAATPPAATPAAEIGPVNDDEFIPREELSADEEVTFPVSI